MGRVVFFLKELGPKRVEAIKAIRSVTGLAVQEIAGNCNSDIPLIDEKLFNRKNPQFPGNLFNLMCLLDNIGTKYIVYELLNDQSYSSEEEFFKITPERLREIMTAHEVSIKQNRSSI